MAEVLVMGEMLVEIMRPEANIPFDQEGYFRGPFPSGAPAIFIDTVARLGHSTCIIGGVGKDDFGQCLLKRLTKDGVDCRYVLESDKNSTGVAFVTYFGDGSRKFIYHMGNTPAVEAKAPDISNMNDLKYMHIMGCSLLPNPEFAKEILKLMKAAKTRSAKISFDPNIRIELLRDPIVFKIINQIMENTNVFLPGVEELIMISGESTVEKAIEKCFENPVLEILALKNGSKGCKIYTRYEMIERGVYAITPVDATGAGDSFDGAFISGLLEGKDLIDVVEMASAAGALNMEAFGPMEGNITPETIREMIENNKLL